MKHSKLDMEIWNHLSLHNDSKIVGNEKQKIKINWENFN